VRWAPNVLAAAAEVKTGACTAVHEGLVGLVTPIGMNRGAAHRRTLFLGVQTTQSV